MEHHCNICFDNLSTDISIRPCNCDKNVHRKCFNKYRCESLDISNIFQCPDCNKNYTYFITKNNFDIFKAFIKHLLIILFDVIILTTMLFLILTPCFFSCYLGYYVLIDIYTRFFILFVLIELTVFLCCLDLMLILSLYIMLTTWTIMQFCRTPRLIPYWDRLLEQVDIENRTYSDELLIIPGLSVLYKKYCALRSWPSVCSSVHIPKCIQPYVLSFIIIMVLVIFVQCIVFLMICIVISPILILLIKAICLLIRIIRCLTIHSVHMYKICYINIYIIEDNKMLSSIEV